MEKIAVFSENFVEVFWIFNGTFFNVWKKL